MKVIKFTFLISLLAIVTSCSSSKVEPSNAMKIYELSVGGVSSVTTSYYVAVEKDGQIVKSDPTPYYQYEVQFDEQGRLIKDGDSEFFYTEEGLFEKGVPYTEYLDGMETVLEFDEKNQIISKITQSPDGLYCTQASTQEYIYDNVSGIPLEDNWQGGEYSLSVTNTIENIDGQNLIMQIVEVGAGYDEVTTTTMDYEYTNFDKNGNWTQRMSISTYITENIDYSTNEAYIVDDPDGEAPQYVITEREIRY